MKIEKPMDKIRYALDQEKRLEVQLPIYTMDQRKYVDLLLSLYLQECGLDFLKDRLLYCLHEIAGNAHKANAKRLFFQLEDYDIRDPESYLRGMEEFKNTVSDEICRYNLLLKEQGYYVNFRFHLEGDRLRLEVVNSASLLSQEEERIQRKIEIAGQYHTITDAYPDAEDFTEGAGLGIVMIYVMIKAIGFRDFDFSVHSRRGETLSLLDLNLSSYAPQFPEDLRRYQAESL